MCIRDRLRAAVLTPYMNDKDKFEEYTPKIKSAIQDKLERIYKIK